MKKWLVFGIVVVGLLGCYCKRCYGQAERLNQISNDLVVNATEAKEFKRVFLDLCNQDLEAAADMLFVIATGNQMPKAATATVAINTAQLNRWFNTTDQGSFLNRAYWQLGQVAVKKRQPARAIVAESCQAQAAGRIADATKRQRFLNRLDLVQSTEE